MGKEKKISVRTPSVIYEKLILRAHQLDLSQREYLLALAMRDLEVLEPGRILSYADAKRAAEQLKQMDIESNQ